MNEGVPSFHNLSSGISATKECIHGYGKEDNLITMTSKADNVMVQAALSTALTHYKILDARLNITLLLRVKWDKNVSVE